MTEAERLRIHEELDRLLFEMRMEAAIRKRAEVYTGRTAGMYTRQKFGVWVPTYEGMYR